MFRSTSNFRMQNLRKQGQKQTSNLQREFAFPCERALKWTSGKRFLSSILAGFEESPLPPKGAKRSKCRVFTTIPMSVSVQTMASFVLFAQQARSFSSQIERCLQTNFLLIENFL